MIKAIIASELSREAVEMIKSFGVDVVEFSANENLGDLGYHADLSVFTGKDAVFVCSDVAYLAEMLKNYSSCIVVSNDYLSKDYPENVKFNCVQVGRYLICNIGAVSEKVLRYHKDNDFNIINVRQGYAKCSVLPVTENALITDDSSVASKCSEAGIDVLFVSKGSVELKGYNYGFIGGCAGKISDDIIAFNGNLDYHSDSEIIKDFLKKHSINYINLFDGKLTDIGSILPIYGGNLNEKE